MFIITYWKFLLKKIQVYYSNQNFEWKPFQIRIRITDRKRNFDAPDLNTSVQGTFGGEIEMLGYKLNGKTTDLEVTIYWRAIEYVTRDYKYFVHLWHDGEIIAQVDSMPMKWQYPTSWWAPQEIVGEKIVFDLRGLNNGKKYANCNKL